MEVSTSDLRILIYLTRKTIFVIQSVTFLLTFSRMFQKGVMQNILSILSLLKIVLILLLSSTPTRVMWRIHSYLFHASRISVNNLWKCFESAYEVEVQCIEYFVVDRDTIDPHALWDLNWVNFPFSVERSIYQSTLQHI